jgi:hypothetical protein
VARQVELGGVTVVGAGPFNPAVFQPRWLRDTQLITEELEKAATEGLVVSDQITTFVAGWLTVQATTEKAIFATVEEGHEGDLRDFAANIFEILGQAPILAVGINHDAHFYVESVEAWHEIGDLFLPKDQWEAVFPDDGGWTRRTKDLRVGLLSMKVVANRAKGDDYVSVEVAPSKRITPNGVYVGINSHFQLTEAGSPSTCLRAASLIRERWEEVRNYERKLLAGVMKWGL